jgi:hypothetical protein
MLNKYLYLWQKEIKKKQLKDKKVSEKILDLIGTPIGILEDANYSLGEKSRWNSSTFSFILDFTFQSSLTIHLKGYPFLSL